MTSTFSPFFSLPNYLQTLQTQTRTHIQKLLQSHPQLQQILLSLPPFPSREIQHQTLQTIEFLFLPRHIFHQTLLWIALDIGAITLQELLSLFQHLASHFSSRSRFVRQLQTKQQTATTQDEWMDLAEQMDMIQGNDHWRSDPKSHFYEQERITARMDEFVHLMRRHDIFDLMFTLRGGMARNSFGLLHPGLFSQAKAGTKLLVETYHNVVCAALDYVCDAPVPPHEDPIPTEARLAFFNETRHSYGRTALLLSGGAALGFYHVGVVKALMENGLMPRVLSGASAGSIVCAMVGTRTNEECMRDLFHFRGTVAPGHSGGLRVDFFRPVVEEKKEKGIGTGGAVGNVFYNPAGAFHDMKRTWQTYMPINIRGFTSTLYDVLTGQTRPKDILQKDTHHFRTCCQQNIGNFTFQEAFDRTGRILNITVSPSNKSDPPRLLNYLTAPHVLIWSAAVASSSLPGVFQPTTLMVKNSDGTTRYESASSGTRFVDGSMEADLPMQQLSEMFNINHFLISQTNVHAIFFSPLGIFLKTTVGLNPIIRLYTQLLRFVKDQVKGWVRNIVVFLGGQRRVPLWETRRSLISQFVTQEYEGRDSDITIYPWIGHLSLTQAFLYLLYNPTEEDFRIWTKEAERETWKHIPEIKSHIAEEITLDQCVQRLRKKLVQESWEAKLERGRVRERMMNPHSNNKASSSTSFSTTLQKGAGNGSGGDISSTDPTENKLGKGQPSFFTSPSLVQINGSLVHMGGLSLGDRLDLKYDPNYNSESQSSSHPRIPNLVAAGEYENVEDTINDPIHLGWSGRGLSGNRSVSSLDRHEANGSGFLMTRSLSDASGLYMDASDDEGSTNGGGGKTGVGNENVNDPATFIGSSSPHRRMNKAWNDGTVVSHPSNPNSIPSNDDSHAVVTNPGDSGYVKTSSMAEFYYGRRKSRSNTQLRQILMEESNDRVVKSSLDLSEHIRYRQDS